MLSVYILELVDNKYYVGKTDNILRRTTEHLNLLGSAWTKKYNPVKIMDIIENCDDYDEDKYTLKYMNNYGIDNVRGGSFCEVILSEETIKIINKMLNGSNNNCYVCGAKDHFVDKCDKIKNKNVKKLNKLNKYNKFSVPKTLDNLRMEDPTQFQFSETEFAKKLFELAGDIFIYQHNDCTDSLKLYCYNGNYWVPNSLLLEKYIVFELFGYYDDLYKSSYKHHKRSKEIRRKINGLQSKTIIQRVVHQYKYVGAKNMSFDDKWWLFGFTNMVFDLKIHEFRQYRLEDYVSITTGYDWIEPTQICIDNLENIILKIMPFEDERELYKQILSTGFEGRCLEKMCFFSGSGRNSKGFTTEFMLHILGGYGIQSNNSILFECAKTGSNPELANLDKKRFVVFKEPPSKRKIENSIIKELTGGGKISARSHYETQTQKILHNTTICECNTKPKLEEISRIIDLPFRSTFVDAHDDVDESKNIYLIDLTLKSIEFRDEHKYAFIKILMDAHIRYANNNYTFIIPQSVKKRTDDYLEESCDILGWFNENYICDPKCDKGLLVKIKCVYEKFKMSDYYALSSVSDKKVYTYNYFIKYFSTNMKTQRYYMSKYDRIVNGERIQNYNILLNFSEITEN